MDPNATLALIFHLLTDVDHPDGVREELTEALQNLTDWVGNGGFIPELSIEAGTPTRYFLTEG